MSLKVRLADWLQAFLGLSLGARIALGTLLGALGSSGIVAFLSEYAVANYALAYGARLPTEGIPYLRFAAAAFSFALFVVALGSFFGLYAVVRFFLNAVFSYAMKTGEDLQTLPLRKFLTAAIPGAFLATQPLMGTLVGNNVPGYLPLTIALVTMTMLVIFARRPNWIYPFTALTFVALTMGIVATLFTPHMYGQMLAFIRFGGGLPIELVRNCSAPCNEITVGRLFLRTEDYFYLLDDSNKLAEIPARDVVEYRYMLESRWGL